MDTTLFRPCVRDQRIINLRNRWGLCSEDVAVIYVAHNLRLKNYKLLRRVFKQLAITYPQIKLIVIGKRRPRFMLPNSVYAGKQTDMTICYQAADCLVHPTFFDSCANVVLESMSSGLPVVASDVCGANELIRDGYSGFVLPVIGLESNITSLWVRRLSALGTDANLRAKTGANARNAMLENDFMQYVTKFEQVMERCRCRNSD